MPAVDTGYLISPGVDLGWLGSQAGALVPATLSLRAAQGPMMVLFCFYFFHESVPPSSLALASSSEPHL